MKELVNLSEVEKIIGYKFKTKKTLQTALTHSSYSNEHRVESNERLEFLGDAVIEFIITEKLYKEFKGKEGDLSKIRATVVSEKPLAEAVDRLGLEKFLLRGVGESKNTNTSNTIRSPTAPSVQFWKLLYAPSFAVQTYSSSSLQSQYAR